VNSCNQTSGPKVQWSRHDHSWWAKESKSWSVYKHQTKNIMPQLLVFLNLILLLLLVQILWMWTP